MSKKIISDQVLVEQYLQGNESALSVLINRYQSKVYTFIFSRVKNKSITDDIFQDTFFKVVISLKSGKYKEEGKFLAWVLRIARNLIIDYFRNNKKMMKAEGVDEEFDIFSILPLKEMSPEQSIIKNQTLNTVKKLLHFLPKEQKDIIHKRIYKEMSFKDIAEEDDISINTALGRMRYALINLRKLIAEKKINLSI